MPEQSYTSEVKAGERIIRWLGCRGFILNVLKGKSFLGDKAYDSVRFIELLENIGLESYIKIKETFRKGIKSEVRLRAKRLIESNKLYHFRGLIEEIFGEIKNDVGSYERTKSFHVAQLFVLAKFCLFNLWVLFLVFWIFQTASLKLLTQSDYLLY